MTDTKSVDRCSFCNKHKDQVVKLIVGHDVAICNECVDLCQNLLEDAKKTKKSTEFAKLDPQSIHHYLDQYVEGQTQAKIVLSVAVANHYKRISRADQDTEVQKTNVLVIGPTGTGKTLLARTVARYLDVPFVIADATTLTEAGYVGDDVESLIGRLYSAAGNDIKKTQRGIVFLDEVDKIARKSENPTVSRDVSGEGVQQALLKLIEGTRCKVSVQGGRKNPGSDSVEIDTTDILFIVGGAFVGLDEIVKKRTQGTTIGFNVAVDAESNADSAVNYDDLVKYGMIPEFVGRFPNVITLESLTKPQLIKILTQVKNNLIEQYQWLFKQDGIELEFDSESLELIAERTMSNRTGARGLHTELERVLLPHMYNLQDYQRRSILKIAIDKTQVNNPVKFIQGNK